MVDTAVAFLIFFALFAGTFFCGYLPSCISAPRKVMNKIALFGGGTIIGAALIIVLPEACGILINAQVKLDEIDGKVSEEIVTPKMSSCIGTAIILGFSLMLAIDETFKILKENQQAKQEKARLASE